MATKLKVPDHILFGLTIALILPLIFGWLYVQNNFARSHDVIYIIKTMVKVPMLFSKLISVMQTPNLFLIFVFYKTDKWKTLWGLFAGTILYFAASLIIMHT